LAGMQIGSLEFRDSILSVRCLGVFGIGTDGNPSGMLLSKSIKAWMETHPEAKVEQIDVDFTEVDYTWGDGPVSCLVIFVAQGVARIHFIPSHQNRKPLENLIKFSKFPWFTVGEAED
jgi:hypothetical protein